MKRRIAALLALLAMACLGLSALATTVGATPEPKVTICHAAGLEGTTHYITLTISGNAVYGPGGHFNENGTPQAGHEQDYLGACADETTTTTTADTVTTSTVGESTTTLPSSTTTSTSVPEPTTTTTAVAGPPTTLTSHPALPRTGSATGALLAAAAVLLGVGSAGAALNDRRKHRA